MKKTMYRVLSAVMSLALLVAAVSVAPFTATAAEDQPILAFVPLDNRPVCVDRIQYQAASAGFDVRMPEEKLYTTLLDGQGGNNPTYGCQVGDGASIMTWLEQMDAAGCNYYIIHLDQMFSGGLVGSRFPDTNTITDTQRNIMDRLIALSNDGNNHIYFVDTVMRLASTGGFKGFDGVAEYGSFREYGAKVRKQLSTSGFYTSDYEASVGQINSIVANYQIGANGETLTYYTGTKTEWKAPLTQDMINYYHGSRQRKLTLINLMMQFGNRKATYIIGVDDASPQFTIQGNEIAFIRARMETLGYDYFLSADTDSSGMMAVARCVTDYYNDTEIPVKVRYFGDQIDVAADDYDIGTLRENVNTHLESANCKVVDGEGEIEVLVLTKISSTYTIQSAYGTLTDSDTTNDISADRLQGLLDENAENINALITQAKANIAANKPTIIVEASTEGNYQYAWVKGETNLQEELLKNVEISKLLGYSNWNTVGNTLGISIGQGVARYSYLKNEPDPSAASHVAFTKAATFGFIKDITYNARNKHSHFTWTFQYWLRNTLKAYNSQHGTSYGDGNFYQYMFALDGNTDSGHCNEWDLCDGEHTINNELTWSMMRGGDASAYNGCAQQVLNALMAGNIYTKLGSRVTTAEVGQISLARFDCPWYRQFEIRFSIDASVYYYSKGTTLVTQIPMNQTFADFKTNAGLQYSATSVMVKNLQGQTLTASQPVGTGFTITMTINGTSSSYQAVVRGDINGNATTDSTDTRDCLMAVVGAYTLNEAQTAAADYDGNAKISSTDARQILQKAITM